MPDTPSLSSLNPFGSFNIGLGAIGNALLLFFIGIVIIGLIGFLIYTLINRKRYKFVIPLYRLIGSTPQKIAIYKAKEVSISKAGDMLWFVKGKKRYIAPATIQSAPNEYLHWERQDGEWINFGLDNLDEVQRKAGVKFIHQDMRSQRVATATILEHRLIQKSFWDKYKDVIFALIFFFILTICMVVIFWQWGKIVENTGVITSDLNQLLTQINNLQCVTGKPASLIPTGG